MKNLKAFLIMFVWTTVVGLILYKLDAHVYYRNIVWAFGISFVLLLAHMVNMVIYFKVAGNTPYQWFKQ